MTFSGDTLLERMHLKRQLVIWRLLAIGVLIFTLVQLFEREGHVSSVGIDFVAKLRIEGVISDDAKRDELLKTIKENDRIKALILELDTPGGTAVGGEELYHHIKAISEVKPVVATMRTLCASAGYMTAIAADHLIARESSITGSIGVIMQTAEVTELAKKLGVTPITVKSGPMKAAPSPVEKFSPAQREIVQGVINSFYQVFVDMVAKERKMTDAEVKVLADGRIYSARQALENGLIDALGGEKEALEWLQKEHKIDPEIGVREMKVQYPRPTLLEKLGEASGLTHFFGLKERSSLDGLLLIWQP